MICEKVFYPDETNQTVHLTCYLHEQSPEYTNCARPAILVLPGGGYQACCDREGEPIALAYMSRGFNAFVLKYSIKERASFPRPLVDAALSVKFIKDNAERFNIDRDHIFAIGFSAGAHLCASLGTFWNTPLLQNEYNIPKGDARVCGTILAYPVITGGVHAHRGSIETIAACDNKRDATYYSIENHVHNETSPAFIWHTFEDACVPVQNSLLMASAMKENGVPFELHIFPKGPHGLSLSNKLTSPDGTMFINKEAEVWFDLSLAWMNTLIENK